MQYVIVAIIVLAALGYTIHRIVARPTHGCAGCKTPCGVRSGKKRHGTVIEYAPELDGKRKPGGVELPGTTAE
jgi:hypothetical protein